MTIYKNDLDFFLQSYSTTLDEISDIWREEGGFVSMTELAKHIIVRKKLSAQATDAMMQIADLSFPKDFRSGAFERQNFFYALADYYAETTDEPTALVEFDVGNCNGTGDYAGDDAVLNVIRTMRSMFEDSLTKHGARFVQSFDNAKNDDLKLIVTGLTHTQLTAALIEAQSEIQKTFIVGVNIPHSKHKDGNHDGIGVGSGFTYLGRGRDPQKLQERLNAWVEKRKLEDAVQRSNIRNKVDASLLKKAPSFVRDMLSTIFKETGCKIETSSNGFPFAEQLEQVRHIENPFVARSAACNKLAEDQAFSDEEKKVFRGIVDFYHSSEALTGAQKSPFLFEDMKWVREHGADPVTILNVKVENCAGINKVLSHIHSAEMTKHFAKIVEQFVSRNFNEDCSALSYYAGRNTFNVIIPSHSPDAVENLFKAYLQDDVDQQINSRKCGEYFESLGLEVDSSLKDMKVGDIPNLRGLQPGVLAINIKALDSVELACEKDVLDFQNRCLSSTRADITSSAIMLPGGVSYHEFVKGKTVEERLVDMKEMVNVIIKEEAKEEGRPVVEEILGEQIKLDKTSKLPENTLK